MIVYVTKVRRDGRGPTVSTPMEGPDLPALLEQAREFAKDSAEKEPNSKYCISVAAFIIESTRPPVTVKRYNELGELVK